jgi:hypothetical protein
MTLTIQQEIVLYHGIDDCDHTRDSAALTESWTLQYDDNGGHIINTTIYFEFTYVSLLVIYACPKLAKKEKGHFDVVSSRHGETQRSLIINIT